MLATTLQNSGASEAGLRVVAEAKHLVACHNEHMWDAELGRIEAELLGLRAHSASESQEAFLSALATARRQGAKSFELRAAIGLGKLWACQGRWVESRDLLGPLYGSFTEGFDTIDMRQAKRLLLDAF